MFVKLSRLHPWIDMMNWAIGYRQVIGANKAIKNAFKCPSEKLHLKKKNLSKGVSLYIGAKIVPTTLQSGCCAHTKYLRLIKRKIATSLSPIAEIGPVRVRQPGRAYGSRRDLVSMHMRHFTFTNCEHLVILINRPGCPTRIEMV